MGKTAYFCMGNFAYALRQTPGFARSLGPFAFPTSGVSSRQLRGIDAGLSWVPDCEYKREIPSGETRGYCTIIVYSSRSE